MGQWRVRAILMQLLFSCVFFETLKQKAQQQQKIGIVRKMRIGTIK